MSIPVNDTIIRLKNRGNKFVEKREKFSIYVIISKIRHLSLIIYSYTNFSLKFNIFKP
jgi:hypothetical protein